jgi:precorrin-2 dehydrogenase/sirohydrochlorin ferrochelatase
MYPLALDLKSVNILFVGGDERALRRLRQLDEDGASQLAIYAENASPAFKTQAGARLLERLPTQAELHAAQLVIIVDVEDKTAFALADIARAGGALVNVEDRKEYCDFHFPAYFRRGDLLIAISTGGASPSLAGHLKAHLQELFGEEWADKLEAISRQRDEWRKAGISNDEIKARTSALVAERKAS